MGKKIFTFNAEKFCLSKPVALFATETSADDKVDKEHGGSVVECLT